MSSIQMTVPIVFWGGKVPSHEITQICKSGNSGRLATGCKTGELCLWTFHKEKKNDNIELHPQHLLIGSGESEILSLCFVKNWTGDRNRVASLTAKGQIHLWDCKDGTCVKYTTLPGKHNHIKTIERSRQQETLLICWGQYPDIFILDSSSLQILFMLRSSHTPNWLQQLCVVPNVEHRDAVIAATMEGYAKSWLLPANKVVIYQDLQPEVLYEERSVTLNLLSVLTMTSFSNGHHSSVLVVTEGVWQLYDATGGQMKLLAIHPCEKDVRQWQGGDFISMDTIAVWSKEGVVVIYKLSARCVPGHHDAKSSDEEGGSTSGAEILAILQQQQPHPLNKISVSSYCYYVLTDIKFGTVIVQGDYTGRVCMWRLPELLQQKQPSPSPLSAHVTQSLANSWDHPAMPCALTDPLGKSPYPDITCGLYLPLFGRLVCGRSDGTIVSFSAAQAATLLLLQHCKFTRGWPQHCIMTGHNGRVNHLLYPSAYRSVFDAKYILSGGVDFTVRMWDIYSGSLVHTFSAHSGAVTDIVVCPENMSPRLQTCVCSIAEDHSVAILSTSQKKCLLLAASHASPIVGIHWRPVEDFLLVNCADGRLYVWQVEACVLDRCIEGSWAQAVLANTPDVTKKQMIDDNALKIHNLKVGGDAVTQVLLFDPQSVMKQLSRMHELEEKLRTREQSKADAFRSYLSAKKQYNVAASLTHVQSMPAMHYHQQQGHHRGNINQDSEKTREKLSQGIASERSSEYDQLSTERTKQLISIVRLLLSCLHAWNLDKELDKSCITQLGLVKPTRPVSYGLLSRGSCLSLVLPGWGLHKVEEMSSTDDLTGKKKSIQLNAILTAHQLRWQLSQSLTTQHLLTVVSITNTLMNQSFGARMLAKEGGTQNLVSMSSDDSDDDEDQGRVILDNTVRATWSQVAALHCVMLPEKLGDSFRPPHLPVLAGRYLDKCLEIREAAQALLQSELRRVGTEGRKELVTYWSSKLPPLSQSRRSRGDVLSQISYDQIDSPKQGAIATPQQQYTALIILGLIGAEFSKPKTSRRSSSAPSDMMEDTVARQTARSLQNVLLDTKPSLHTNLRRSAIDLIGRGFHLWEKYLNVPLVLVGLLDLAIQWQMKRLPSATLHDGDSDNNARVLTSSLARKALITMVMAHPSSIISALAKEVSTYLAHSHTTHHPHSSFPLQIGVQSPPSTLGIVTPSNKLLSDARGDIFVLIEAAIDKCMHKVTLQLVEVVDILLFCMDTERLKKEKNLMDNFPLFKKLPIVSYCTKSRCMAVGAQSGRVAIYDLKHFKCHMLNAHSYPITALNFSDDGKMLATYAYGDSTLSIWLLVSGLFGGIMSSSPKCVQSWPAISGSSPSQSFSSTSGLYYNTSLEWSSNKSVVLRLPGAVECRYSL